MNKELSKRMTLSERVALYRKYETLFEKKARPLQDPFAFLVMFIEDLVKK